MALEYYRRGTSEVRFLATAPASPPTAANITASVNLSTQLNAIDGFTFETEFIEVETLSTRTTPKLAGPENVEGGTLTFNEKKTATVTPATTDPIMVALAKDASGYLLFCPYGSAVGNDVEVWPVTVGSFSRAWDMGATPAKWMASFASTAAPTQHATIAA